ncbi:MULTISPECIES: TrkA family potassium uptake protein [unclassified Rossellomorea]|uniref:potassium channel family protein n=1 Tax=unclassified Rossellomorea TaxID=2837526 RepID=UPI0020C6114D|nr:MULTISPECIES: TrkA family potassium uptake protein [unclassified Rossellomorea]UTE76845.1 TrkA family potassium uptake protein [Rossellomorea sp. KS-H15a]WGG44761.1 TrkA family potassium uptake protein [Rossellomorea sp. DA94]
MKKQFAVIGLGRFGGNLVMELSELGVEVLAIDRSEEVIERFSSIATHAVQANAMEESVLRQLGLRNFDHVIVSFGENIEASILTTLQLKELGVKEVWVKASNVYHQKVLDKIGADKVIHPERDMAKRIAHHVTSEKIIDYIELSNEHSIIEVVATKKVAGKTLVDLDIRARYGCNIIAIQRNGEILVSPPADELVQDRDMLIVIGHKRDLHRFEKEGV